MSFSNEVKKELCQNTPGVRHCLMAEAAAVLFSCGQLKETEKGRILSLETDQELIAQRFGYLMNELFHIELRVDIGNRHIGRKKKYEILLDDDQEVMRILETLKIVSNAGKFSDQDIAVNEVLIMSECCRRAYLRGMFLSSGTMSTPEKNYHLEFVCSGLQRTEQLMEIIRYFGLHPKLTMRKESQIVYMKEGHQVSDMLNVIQATVSLLEYENIRIKREIRGNINRKVNCEAANISKTVAAAYDQLQDICLIRDTVGLEQLTPDLYETAQMRLKFTDTSLKELGLMMIPPVGKSGMNHRFQRLKKMADQLRVGMEE